ncbi:unnamed protein product, partial [Chrysoparadoxa australica]
MIPATEGLCAAVGGTFSKVRDAKGRYTAICSHPIEDPAGGLDAGPVLRPVARPALSVVPDGPPSAAFMPHCSDLALLHPSIRGKVQAVQSELAARAIPMKVFETFRSPHRQAALFARGRTLPGTKVTHAAPWASYHQYGLAADFGRFENNSWNWQTKTARHRKDWDTFHDIARDQGLEPTNWQKPHVQVMAVSITELMNGAYPDEGDDSWANNLREAIKGWSAKGAPPAPGGQI